MQYPVDPGNCFGLSGFSRRRSGENVLLRTASGRFKPRACRTARTEYQIRYVRGLEFRDFPDSDLRRMAAKVDHHSIRDLDQWRGSHSSLRAKAKSLCENQIVAVWLPKTSKLFSIDPSCGIRASTVQGPASKR